MTCSALEAGAVFPLTIRPVLRVFWPVGLAAVCLAASASAASLGGITGFGATNAAWNQTHVQDPNSAPGAAYDPDPSLPNVNGHTAARYYAVIHEDGHVLGYEYRFHPLPISLVKALVLLEFPSDVHVVWFRAVGASCAQMLVRSPTVGRALGTKKIGDPKGVALIEFSSGALEDSYNARSVNDALFMLYPFVSKSGAPAC
jgi:hypothetical protein